MIQRTLSIVFRASHSEEFQLTKEALEIHKQVKGEEAFYFRGAKYGVSSKAAEWSAPSVLTNAKAIELMKAASKSKERRDADLPYVKHYLSLVLQSYPSPLDFYAALPSFMNGQIGSNLPEIDRTAIDVINANNPKCLAILKKLSIEALIKENL